MQKSISDSHVIPTLSGVDAGAALALLPPAAEMAWADLPPQTLFEKVERAKQEWEATADALPELICLIDDRGRIVRANRTVETWGLGQVVEVKERDLHGLLHAGCAALFCPLNRFLQQAREMSGDGLPAEHEAYDSILKRHLHLKVQPVSSTRPIGSSTSAVVIQDITERKRAEEALFRRAKRLEVMNEIGEAILAACSPEDVAHAALSRIRPLVPYRQARVTLFRSESDEFLVLAADANGGTHVRPGRTFRGDAFRGSPERRPDRFFVVADLAQLADLSHVEHQLARESIHAYLNIPLVADGECVGALSLGSTFCDAFDHEHVQIAREVADLVAISIRQTQLTEKLKRTNAELQAALQAKEEMVQNVSHELRSPLNLICGYADLLESADLGPLTDRQARAALIMRQQGERLHFMIDRLLLLQTFDAVNLQPMPLNVAAWLPQVARPFEVRMAGNNIRLQVEVAPGLPSLIADPDFLGHVITNLLDNAIKFSPDGGQIRVSARAGDERIVIAMSDDGIGIPPDKLARVFERFYQVDSRLKRSRGGMGIGLALCHKIVEAHHGQIWAESAGEGHGSTFCLALPAVAAQAEEVDAR